ncbi:hypothetical protein [Oceanibaculum indicum]|uniref:Uncharacterized protein n=1 Tax=Oceanibaculum indicum P24 TaxID=1207063 RepID=K2K6C2_9PROT|nr:hypothetical protein [Oceanibaculum indicum]EKE78424.1 hypothetical protein P24_02651 [Oceanibaculum indicum P24]
MAITVEDAITKLTTGYWNKNARTEANPGGFGANGHVDNLPALAEALGVVGAFAGTQGELADEVLALQAQINAVVAAGDDIVIVAEDIAAVLAAAANMAAILAAPGAAAAASGFAGEAEGFRDETQIFRNEAQAAVGGARVSATDTIAGGLFDKIEVGGGLTKEISAPGGNEKLLLTVPPLTDLIGNIMALAWTVAELQGAALTGYANMVVDAFEDDSGIDAEETTFAVYNPGTASWKSVVDQLSISYQTAATSSSALFTYTFAAQPLGTAAPDRTIVVGVASRNTNGSKPTAVTIAGESAALAVETWTGAENEGVSIWHVLVPEGASGDVVVTCSNIQAGCAVGVWAVYGPLQVADVDAASVGSDTNALSVDVPAGCVIAAMAIATGNFTWSGASERFDNTTTMGISVIYSGADVTPGTAGPGYGVTAQDNSGGGQNTAAAAVFGRMVSGARDLVSVPLTAASDPTSLVIGAEIEVPALITLGTDLMLYGSIDDGASWEEVAAYQTYAAAGGRLLVFGTADVTGQTGTDVRIRAATAEGEIVTIHKWGVQADVALTPPA